MSKSPPGARCTGISAQNSVTTQQRWEQLPSHLANTKAQRAEYVYLCISLSLYIYIYICIYMYIDVYTYNIYVYIAWIVHTLYQY